MARLLADHREIDGVWTRTTSWPSACSRRWRRPAARPKVVGVNGLPEAIDNIERGTMQASVDFSAFNIAGIAARAALRHLRGEAGAGLDHGAGGADRSNQLSALEGALRIATDTWHGRGAVRAVATVVLTG